MQPTATDRRSLIAKNLGVSAAYSPAADTLIDQFQCLMADAADLDAAERARLLSAMMVQISTQLAALHGA